MDRDYAGRIRLAPALGAIRFGETDPLALTDRLCAALGASIISREFLTWVERVDLASAEGPVVLFNDEDGSSHLELPALDRTARERVVALLREAGFVP